MTDLLLLLLVVVLFGAVALLVKLCDAVRSR
jgi:hypothetical protein